MVTACAGGLTLGDREEDIISQFWPVWLELEGQLYRRCLGCMKGNVTEAEDALSQARIKAWEQVQKHASKIGNLKAWLIKLTINLCKDIIDKRSRGPAAVEDIELVGDDGALCTASSVPLPEKVLETNETSEKIRRAVASLPQKQRDTFILHFYEGLKHKEIVERLGISYDNVCKRLSLARQGLKKALQSYFRDEEQKLQKSPTPQGRVEKRKIESPVELELELTTVSTASDGVVGEGLLVFKDGAVERSADVEENMVEKELNSAKLSIGKDCVGEEKLDLISGAGEHLAPVSSSRKEESILGLAQMSEPTPLFMVDKQNILEDVSQVSADDVMGVVQVIVEHESTPVCTQLDASTPVRAPVASGELLLSRAEQKPGFCEVFFHGDRDSKRNPVSQGRRALGNGSARSPGGTVRAANAIAPVVVDRKLSDVSTVDVEHMLWDDGSRVRSPVTPRASGFHRFGSQLPATVAPEWVPVRDIVGKNIGDVPGNGSARSHSPPGIVEMLTGPLGKVVSAIAPVVVDGKPDHVSTEDVEHMLSDVGSRVRSPVTPRASGFHRFGSQLPATVAPEWVPVWDIVGKNIGDVPGNGSAREHSPPGIVDKRTRPLSEVLSKETVKAGSAIAPVVVDRKPDYVSTVDVDHMLWDDGSRVRSPVTPRASGFHRFGSQLPATVAPEWVPVRDIVGKNIGDVPGNGSARSQEKTPPGILEKRTRPLSEVLSKETIRAARAMAPVVVDRKPDDVRKVVGGDTRPSPSSTPATEHLSPQLSSNVGNKKIHVPSQKMARKIV